MEGRNKIERERWEQLKEGEKQSRNKQTKKNE
jgi:hypothetical protein